MNDQPANPWHDATEKPKAFPILYRTRFGHFDVMVQWLYPAGRSCRNWQNVTHWKAIEAPPDVQGKEAHTAEKLIREDHGRRKVNGEKRPRNRLNLEHPDLYKGPGRPVRRLEGQRFGRLTVLVRSSHRPQLHSACWTCRCDCGQTTRVAGNSLVRGVTRSCGCLRRERRQPVGFDNATTD